MLWTLVRILSLVADIVVKLSPNPTQDTTNDFHFTSLLVENAAPRAESQRLVADNEDLTEQTREQESESECLQEEINYSEV